MSILLTADKYGTHVVQICFYSLVLKDIPSSNSFMQQNGDVIRQLYALPEINSLTLSRRQGFFFYFTCCSKQ